MSTFAYKGFDRGGRAARGLVEAASVKDARERLAGDGILAETIRESGGGVRFPAELRSVVYQELGALLGAGMTLVQALDILAASPELRRAGVLVAGVRDRVREGMALSESLAAAGPFVTPCERAILAAAERSGSLDLMLERLAQFLNEQEKLKARVQGALIYPLIVLTVGLCVAILMLGLLLPRTRSLMVEAGSRLPVLTVFMIGAGNWLLRWGPLAAVATAVAVVLVKRRWRRDDAFRRELDRGLFRLPVLGRGLTLLVNLRFARTLSILLHGGVSLIDGLVLAGEATGSPWVAALAREQAEGVRHGRGLSEAVGNVPPLARTLPGWVRIGEAGGGLEKLLGSAAARFEDRWERYVGRCLSFLEPLLILAIGGFVLLVTLSILLPVLNLSQAL